MYVVATRLELKRLREEASEIEAFEELAVPNTVWLGPYAKNDADFMLHRLGKRYEQPLDKEKRCDDHKCCHNDGILSFALHPQQGQPDTFWLYQSFTSEAYYSNTFTTTIYTANRQGRIQKSSNFLPMTLRC